jgi:peptidoglycan/LPS O-acetylase OafA/YrhL
MRVPVLDGIRAAAILLVILGHAIDSASPGAGHFFGWLGVAVFFVLSGYLITSVLLADETRNGHVQLGRFYRRRALRILPGLTVFLVVLAALAKQGILETPDRTTWWASALYFRNLAGGGWDTGHLWSLALEEQFYCVWPAALVLVRKSHRLGFIASVILICTVLRFFWTGPAFDFIQRPDLRLDTFLIGGALALRPWELIARVPLAVALIGAAFWTPVTVAFRWTRPVATPVSAALIAIVIWWLVTNPQSLASRYLSTAFMVWIGTISYGLYLWQQLLLGPHFRWWSLPAVVVAALASYLLVERPFLRFKDRAKAGAPASEAGAACRS